VAETADLKSLARRVLDRDAARDTSTGSPARGCVADEKPARHRLVSGPGFAVLGAYGRCMAALQERCPVLIDERCRLRAIEDGSQFLEQWGDKAKALGWTAQDLFGLPPVPDHPSPTYRRLSRYDGTGLIWLLHGRVVVALTQDSAVIAGTTGAVTIYRKNNKPPFGPVGDSLDDFE
jgi:hypothetical protein